MIATSMSSKFNKASQDETSAGEFPDVELYPRNTVGAEFIMYSVLIRDLNAFIG